MLPKPFSKLKIVFGEPIHITDGSKEEAEKYSQEIESALNKLTAELDREFNIQMD